jgi:hypothetical protein
MSLEEMRSYCLSIKSYNLSVQVRLKDSEICTGKIGTIEDERFQLVTEDEVRSVRFSWVARITNA